MLEYTGLDQGAGLWQLAQVGTHHVISVLHHGDRAAEMGALWQTCHSLQRLGHRLGVLDTTAAETAANPGLQGMLDHGYRPSHADDAGWCITPAATGIRSLRDQLSHSTSGQKALERLFSDFSALVVYADADTLAATTDTSAGLPVLAISPEMPSLLSAYNSLKQLASQTTLRRAAVVTVRSADSPRYLSENIAKSLQNCTMKYLKCKLHPFHTRLMFDGDWHENEPEDMRQLVLQLLGKEAPYAGSAPVQRPARKRPAQASVGNVVSHQWSH